MKIRHLRITNFRGIRLAELKDTGDAVVIAGPNGSGKSCVLDAIRLFKSAYGSYESSEMDLWSNEFQLTLSGGRRDMRGLLRDKSHAMTIEGEVEISDGEKQFIVNDGQWMVRELVWKARHPHVPTYRGRVSGILTPDLLKKSQEVEQVAIALQASVANEIQWNRASGSVTINPNGHATRGDSLALAVLFSFFVPDRMGIIDYHGSHRKYVREQLRTIQLEESDEEEKVKSGALYNYETKYANLKSAMAGEYVRELLERDAKGERTGGTKPLAKTLEELFAMFLPGKTFRGPVAERGGELAFPVWVDGDTQHDINELSSGEKEILFAYLRARTLSPRQSVLLIDEPELHLNPGLVQGLPRFYQRYIGRELENQIWLVTHSDRFLREALDTTGMQVYHMQHAKTGVDKNQLRVIENKHSVERLIIDLVGDLASYRPDGKVVLLEGEDSRFDQKMVARLFPELAREINFISGGAKRNVKRLQSVIEEMAVQGQAHGEVFSIVDPDADIWERDARQSGRQLEWTVYHIENYLLDRNFIRAALGVVQLEGAGRISDRALEGMLEAAAEELIEELARRRVHDRVHRALRKATAIEPTVGPGPGGLIASAVDKAAEAVQELRDGRANEETLSREIEQERQFFRTMWSDGLWRTKFPGKEVLRRFCGTLGGNIDYMTLRTAIVGEMAKAEFRPGGMAGVIAKIQES